MTSRKRKGIRLVFTYEEVGVVIRCTKWYDLMEIKPDGIERKLLMPLTTPSDIQSSEN